MSAVARCGAVRLAVLVLALAGSVGTARAGELDDLFARAGEAYAEGRYGAAEQDYRRLLDDGVWDAAVLYNLGNALHRQGRLADARLAWERAARLDPGAADLRQNLDLVVETLGLGAPETGPGRVLRELVGAVGLDGWLAVTLLAWGVLGAAVAVVVLGERPRRVTLGVAAVALGVLLVTAPLLALGVHFRDADEAIVLDEELEARSGPSTTETVLGTLPLGARVAVRGEGGGWLRVSVDEGWSGWVPADAVGRIRPPTD